MVRRDFHLSIRMTTGIAVESAISRKLNWVVITEWGVSDCAFLPKIH